MCYSSEGKNPEECEKKKSWKKEKEKERLFKSFASDTNTEILLKKGGIKEWGWQNVKIFYLTKIYRFTLDK